METKRKQSDMRQSTSNDKRGTQFHSQWLRIK